LDSVNMRVLKEKVACARTRSAYKRDAQFDLKQGNFFVREHSKEVHLSHE
jgi:hypothetical protein